ncbi:hypothetical protein MBLNU13_g09991t3 [Cladosporium sp. NU13]
MRLGTVQLKSIPMDVISTILKDDRVEITDSIAVAIAKLVMFFGLDHTSSAEKLSCLVYEIAQEWALTPDSVTHSSWQTKAQWFTHTIWRRSDGPVNFIKQSKIYHAFLDGLRWRCGDVNVRLKGPKAFALMQKRAAKVGLDRPSQIAINELQSAIITTQLSVENRRGRANVTSREFGKSSIARRSRKQLVSGESEVQSAAHDGVGDSSIDDEESHDSSGHQPGDCGGAEDGSDIVLAGHYVQSSDQSTTSSWSEDEIVYE